jgi:hypothetical protein
MGRKQPIPLAETKCPARCALKHFRYPSGTFKLDQASPRQTVNSVSFSGTPLTNVDVPFKATI